MSTLRAVFPLLLFGLLQAGCDSGSPVENEEGPVLADVQEQVFSTSCAGCHGSEQPAAGLDLSAGNSFESTVNVPSTQLPELMLVEPGDADNSYLYLKIIGSDRIPEGYFPMPIGQELTDAQIQLVEDWIDHGALQ